MATDTFTCSRCGQLSYYRDGSYLFGQQVVCARCYAAQAAPPGVPGMTGAMPPGGVPQMQQGYPGMPPAMPGAFGYAAPPPPRMNVCGGLGFVCALVAIACLAISMAALKPIIPEFMEIVKEAQQNKANQADVQKKVENWMAKHQDKQIAMGIGGCGFLFFVLAGLVLSIIGVCLSNVRKGFAITGLVLNGLLVLAPCLLTCLGGIVGG